MKNTISRWSVYVNETDKSKIVYIFDGEAWVLGVLTSLSNLHEDLT